MLRTIFSLGMFALTSAAEPIMNHETVLTTYVEKLNTHSWEQIAVHVAKEAVFVFTEGTFIGHEAAKQSFEKTFALIQNEEFSLHDIAWSVVTTEVAVCHYKFCWKGLISGQQAEGEGRGTSILRKADGRSLQAVVVPVSLSRERQLRLLDWRQSRLRTVLESSQGRIGYLHLRAMGREDIADFAREFYAHVDRDGLVIDMRFNGGGNIDSWVLEKLLRRAWVWWQRRSPPGAPPYPNMQQAFQGHLVVLVNEETYSDGETFSEGFKRLGLGTVIGRRTSGAGVWLSDRNRLLDNGIMRAAETGQMDAQGRFLIEGVGVAPDLEVDNPPRATFEGGDAQLDAALAHFDFDDAEPAAPLQVDGEFVGSIT